MNKFIYILACAFMLSANAQAQPSGAAAPDAGAGKRRAAVCFACHTPEGISRIPGVPHLAGQEHSYLVKVLHSYREGQQRQDPTMTAMVKPLTDADIVNIAAYYSKLTLMNNRASDACIQPEGEKASESPIATTTAVAAPAAIKQGRSGEAVYQESCMACHSTGAAGAPKLGDKTAWRPLLAQGNATLLQHALNGINAMPARGACTNCTDSEIKAAIDYMTKKSK